MTAEHDEPPIHKVRVTKCKGKWLYWGKVAGQNGHEVESERLTYKWLRDNHFDNEFLKKLRRSENQGKWFNNPPGCSSFSVKIEPREANKAVLGSYLLGSRNLGASLIQYPNFHNQGKKPYCISYSLSNAFAYIGLLNRSKELFEKSYQIYAGTLKDMGSDPFHNTVMFLQKLKQFNVMNLETSLFAEKPFCPLSDPTPGNIKLLQIASAPRGSNFNVDKFIDNSHCISIVDNMIFDSNKNQPIKLTRDNLNSCCLGGDRFHYHHVSRGVEFIPSKSMKRVLKKLKNNK